MKIESISLENFGIFKRKCFEFDQAPLVLVYGENEAGKTTALNGIRQAMAGFRHRSGYLVGGTMRAEISAHLRSGQQLEFSRRKGRPDELAGTLGGRDLASHEIQELLANIDLESYEQLFGFSLDELRQGQNALKNVRLSDAFAGGSMGGIRAFEMLRRDLETTTAELYKSRGSTPLINVKLAELKQQHEKLRAAEVLPQQVEALRAAIKAAGKRSQEFQEEIAAHRQELSQLNRFKQALPHFQNRKALLAQLAEINLPPELDAAFIAKWGDYATERSDIAKRMNAEQDKIAKAEVAVKNTSSHEHLLDFEKDVERLGHRAPEIASTRQLHAESQQHVEECQSRLCRLLEQLNQSELSEQLCSFTISIPDRSRLEEASQSWAHGKERLLTLNAKLDATVGKQSEISHSEVADLQFSEHELDDLLARWAKAEGDVEQNSVFLNSLIQSNEFQQLSQQVQSGIQPGYEAESHWRLPDLEKVGQLAKRILAAEKKELELHECQLQIKQELEDARPTDSNHIKSDADKVLADLEAVGKQRNALLEHWLDELSQPLMAASISVEQQQERLNELKRIGDATDEAQANLIGLADELARTRHAQLQIQELVERQENCQKELEELKVEDEAVRDEWNSAWQGLFLVEHLPEQRIRWAETYSRWDNKQRAIEQAKKQLHMSRGLLKAVQAEILDKWPTHVRENADRASLANELTRWKELKRDLVVNEQRQKDAQQHISKWQTEIAAVTNHQSELEKELRNWLKESPADDEWPLARIPQLIEILEAIKREATALARYERKCVAAQEDLAKYVREVNDLALRLQEDTKAIEFHDVHAKDWLEALHSVRSERSQQIRLKTELDHSKTRLDEWSKRKELIDGKLTALCTVTGMNDVQEVSALLEKAKRGELLNQELSQSNAALSSLWPEGKFEQQIEQLDAYETLELEFDLKECQEKLACSEQQRKEAEQQVGSLTQQLEQLSGGVAAQAATQKISLLRGELSDLAEQWVTERIGQVLLKRTIENYSKDHEPKLLGLTRKFLSELTGGRYTDVQHDDAAKESFKIVNQQGQNFEPSQLSTGTREQLYLAIRMAFIVHHCEEYEPLPVLMDDCFVNFDDTRAKNAIESIGNWGSDIQTVLLSCHSRTLDLVRETTPDAKIILLSEVPATVA